MNAPITEKASKAVKLTKRIVDSATYEGPSPRRHVIWDDTLKGLGLRVYPSGEKSYVLSYTVAARKRLATLGSANVMTCDEARTAARQYLADLKRARPEDRRDPLEERRKERQGVLVRDLTDKFIREYASRKRSGDTDAAMIRRFILPAFGSMKVDAVTRADVAALHHKLRKTPYQANRVLALLSRLIELAIRWGFLEEGAANPAKRIDRYKEQSRDRWLKPDELARFWAAVALDENVFAKAALQCYVLLGARKSELLNAKWTDVDFERRELRFPRTKAGRVHYIPLSEPAIAILRALPRLQDNEFVFPGARKGQPLNNPEKPWRRCLDHAECLGLVDALAPLVGWDEAEAQRQRTTIRDDLPGRLAALRALATEHELPKGTGRLEGVRLHDLRRTVGSWLAQSGSSLHLVGKILNHSNVSTTAIYSRFGEDHVRAALEQHARRVLGVVGELPTADVVDIASKRDAKG